MAEVEQGGGPGGFPEKGKVVEAELPPALQQVLTAIPHLGLQRRFEEVFRTAAQAISDLRQLDLSSYESDVAEEARDLQLLEAVAPLLASTVSDVMALVSCVDRNFPPNEPYDLGEPESSQAQRAIETLRERCQALRSDVLQLGNQLRSPQAVADRWNFLNHLQNARGRLRAGMGDMVADAAGVYAEVPRSSVIPQLDQDIENAVFLRRTVARLAVGLRAHVTRLAEGKFLEASALVEGLIEIFGKLAESRTWRELRAPDKREFIRFRSQLIELKAKGAPPAETHQLLKGFGTFLELLTALISQRDALRNQDRACLAELTARLERLEATGRIDPQAARRQMVDALRICERMTGRDEDFDRTVRLLREQPEGTEEEIQILREHTQRLLMNG